MGLPYSPPTEAVCPPSVPYGLSFACALSGIFDFGGAHHRAPLGEVVGGRTRRREAYPKRP